MDVQLLMYIDVQDWQDGRGEREVDSIIGGS